MISATPGLERLQILAHSRGTALTLRAVRELALEAIAAGKEPEDRALLVSRWLFRSRNRVGQLRPEDISERAQRYFAALDRADFIAYEGQRTDFFGHSYFTSNPMVSSDLIQLIRYGKRLGQPGRELVKTGLVTWEFPVGAATPH